MTFISYESSTPHSGDDDTLWGWDDTELVGVGIAPAEQLREVRIASGWKGKISADALSSAVLAAYMSAVMARVSAFPGGDVAATLESSQSAGQVGGNEVPVIDFALMERAEQEREDYFATFQELLADEKTFVSVDGNVAVTARGGSPSTITFDSAWLGFAEAAHIAASTTEALAPAIETGREIAAQVREQFPAIAEFRRLRDAIKAARGW